MCIRDSLAAVRRVSRRWSSDVLPDCRSSGAHGNGREEKCSEEISRKWQSRRRERPNVDSHRHHACGCTHEECAKADLPIVLASPVCEQPRVASEHDGHTYNKQSNSEKGSKIRHPLTSRNALKRRRRRRSTQGRSNGAAASDRLHTTKGWELD